MTTHADLHIAPAVWCPACRAIEAAVARAIAAAAAPAHCACGAPLLVTDRGPVCRQCRLAKRLA